MARNRQISLRVRRTAFTRTGRSSIEADLEGPRLDALLEALDAGAQATLHEPQAVTELLHEGGRVQFDAHRDVGPLRCYAFERHRARVTDVFDAGPAIGSSGIRSTTSLSNARSIRPILVTQC